MSSAPQPHFSGPAYDPAKDQARLATQLETIRDLMLDGVWLSLAEIKAATGHGEASISAQLRHLKKERFGSYRLEKRRRGENAGMWEYRILPPLPAGQMGLPI